MSLPLKLETVQKLALIELENKQLEDKIHWSVLEILWTRNKPRAAVVVFRFHTGDWRMYSPCFRGLANMHLNEFQP